MKKKYLAILAAAIILVPLWYFGILGSMFGVILGMHQPCEETPYDPLCICPVGYARISFNDYMDWFPESHPWYGTYLCEPTELLIDPENDPDWEEKALLYARQQIRDNIEECSEAELLCNRPPPEFPYDEFLLAWGWVDTAPPGEPPIMKREVTVECNEHTTPTSGRGVFGVWFYIEDGSIVIMGDEPKLYCYPPA